MIRWGAAGPAGVIWLFASGYWPVGHVQAQTQPESFAVYTEHPRLLLRPQRLTRLRRERERKSLRWEQFRLLIAGGAPMPEAAFAHALYYRITDDDSEARKAIEAALSPKSSVREAALVYDWCQPTLSTAQKERLKARLHSVITQKAAHTSGAPSIAALRDRAFAAVALGDEDRAPSEAAMRDLITTDWQERVIPALKSGQPIITRRDAYPLLELLHAVSDGLNMDLRQDFSEYFRQLPLFFLLSNYPAPYPASENEFRIPYSPDIGEPDLRVAELARAADLAFVALDTNAPETQVLQGWLMNDSFLMRGTFGIPYEFLWANPYQPGLSYYHVPLVFHDEKFGNLIVRSSWDDSAVWAGYIGGRLQVFRDGAVNEMDPVKQKEPLDLGEARILFVHGASDGKLDSGEQELNDIFLLGLKPKSPFHVEIQDEEMCEMASDPGGILFLKGVHPKLAIRFRARAGAPGPPAATGR
jgi:hypothetical protein